VISLIQSDFSTAKNRWWWFGEWWTLRSTSCWRICRSGLSAKFTQQWRWCAETSSWASSWIYTTTHITIENW